MHDLHVLPGAAPATARPAGAPTRRPLIPGSLQVQIALLLGALLTLLLLAAAQIVGRTAARETEALAGAVVEDLASRMARELALGMYERYRNVMELADNPTLASPAATPERKRAVLDEFRRRYPEFAWLGLVEMGSHEVAAASDGILAGRRLTGRPVFELGRRGPMVGDVHEAVLLASLVPPAPDGRPQWFVDLAAPVRDAAGSPTWVLATHLSWSWAQSVRETVLRALHDQRGIELLVINSAGKVLMSSGGRIAFGTALADAVDALPRAGWSRTAWRDGDHVTAAAASGAFGAYPGLGWTVVARQPVPRALAAVDRINRAFQVGGAVVAGAALLAGWVLAGRLMRPLRRVARAADEIAAGKRGVALPRLEGTGEVSHLARALARFVTSVAESEQRFRVLADTMPQIVWSTGADGCPDYFNERWYEYTGMPRPHAPGGALGWDWKDCLHPDDRAHTVAAWDRSLRTGEPYHVEHRFRGRDGVHRWFIGRALALRDDAGRIARWFGTLTDIHDERLAGQERDALIGRLREADHRKNEFLAMLAHELRNPLAPVLNAARLLERNATLDEAGRRAVAMIDRQTRQMKRLVDDLLEVDRITRGTIALRPEPMRLDAALRQAAEAMQPAFDAKRQALEVAVPAEPVEFVADPARIAQVLENLLGNASKYTPEGGHVRLWADRADRTIEIRVADDGIGIEPDKLEGVFELFVQGQPGVGEHQGGLGIGLAMVRWLVRLHGGTVHARSDGPGRGATFVVRLPVDAPCETPAADVPEASGRTSPAAAPGRAVGP